jgi:hypothetical protein
MKLAKRAALGASALAALAVVLALYTDKGFIFDLANRWIMCF